MTSWYLVGSCTGRSAGFSPLRMRGQRRWDIDLARLDRAVAGIGSLSRTRMVSTVTVIKCNVSVGPFVSQDQRGFDFLAIRTSIRDGKDAEQTEVLPLHCRGGRLAYGVAPIGKTVTTGASQALASSCGTAGGEADGPGHPAGETDTGGESGPCSICIFAAARRSRTENRKCPWICLLGCVDGYSLS